MVSSEIVWYIQHRPNDYDANTQQLIYIIQEMGMEVHCEKYIPFDGMDWSFLPHHRPVIAHGSISAIRSLLKGYNGKHFYPGAWCNWSALTCTSYYAHWGKYLVQKNYGFYPLGEVYRLKNFLYQKYGKNDTIFIRPDANNKTFTGEVVSQRNFDIWKSRLEFDTEPLETLCVVAETVKIHAEYRLIIANNKVITGSKYKNDNVICYESNFPESLIDYAEEVAKTWSPHPIYCLDVAETENGLGVVECGSVNVAGFYACDLRKIIKAMVEIGIREYVDSH